MITVEHTTLADFIAELKAERELIADKTVRWRTSRTPEQEEQVTFEVDVWATALRKGGDEDYLIEFGTVVGCDAKNDEKGSAKAAEMMGVLADACENLNLQLRPGKIELF